jgi:hypothetical protein
MEDERAVPPPDSPAISGGDGDRRSHRTAECGAVLEGREGERVGFDTVSDRIAMPLTGDSSSSKEAAQAF